MSTTVTQVQTATAKADKNGATVVLNGAPKAELLSSWLRDLLRARRAPLAAAQQNPAVNPVLPAPAPAPEPALGLPDPALPPSPALVPTPAAAPSPDPTNPAQNVAQTQNAVAAGISILDVHVRLTVREKLQTLVFASAMGLKADLTADFTPQELESLRQFKAAYDAHFTTLFRGRPMPSLVFELVALKADRRRSGALGRTPMTSICVRGLRSEDEIKHFHQAMSRSATRRLYRGVRLSYEMSLIERPAVEVSEDHEDFPSSLGETLCGTRLVTQRPGHNPWTSTIGGIVQVGDDLYAMTSSHTPDNLEPASASASVADDTASSTLNDSDYDHDVESALVLDPPHMAPFSTPLKPPTIHGVPRAYGSRPLSPRGPVLVHGQDWRLIRLSANRCFPNSVPRELDHSKTTGLTYVTESSRKIPFHGRVLALAGCNGLCAGTLRSSPAFLSLPGSPSTEVWTVVMDSKETLQKGDSGSWVIDSQGRWLGSVTAMAGGDAYIIPAHVQLEQMRAHFNLPVTLPTPLRCYLELAAAPFFSVTKREEFAATALTPDVLAASTSSLRKTAGALAIGKAYYELELKEVLSRPNIRLEFMLARPLEQVPPEIRGYSAFQALSKLHSRLRNAGLDLSPAEIREILSGGLTPNRPWAFIAAKAAQPGTTGMLDEEENPDPPDSTPVPATVPTDGDEGLFSPGNLSTHSLLSRSHEES